MSDGTAVAGLDVFDLSAGDELEWFGFEDFFDIVSKQISAFEVG